VPTKELIMASKWQLLGWSAFLMSSVIGSRQKIWSFIRKCKGSLYFGIFFLVCPFYRRRNVTQDGKVDEWKPLLAEIGCTAHPGGGLLWSWQSSEVTPWLPRSPCSLWCRFQTPVPSEWLTCSLSSDSWPDSCLTRLMVDSSFSCRLRISFCSLSPSLLTRDMARIRGNQSRFFSWKQIHMQKWGWKGVSSQQRMTIGLHHHWHLSHSKSYPLARHWEWETSGG
jgi:hypothetical protein